MRCNMHTQCAVCVCVRLLELGLLLLLLLLLSCQLAWWQSMAGSLACMDCASIASSCCMVLVH